MKLLNEKFWYSLAKCIKIYNILTDDKTKAAINGRSRLRTKFTECPN